MTEKYEGEEPERIALWFVPHTIPYGGAPEAIREQWLGVPLPVRESHVANEADTLMGYSVGMNIDNPEDVVVRHPSEAVVVEALDAFKALHLAGREEAAHWWEEWFETRSYLMGEQLRFQATEGRICTPSEIESEFPGASQFDEFNPGA
jgi:hypothetical protein